MTKTDNVHRVEKILNRTKNRVLVQWRGYSTVWWMWKISCDFHVIVLLLFMIGILLMVLLIKEVEMLSFEDDYLLVKKIYKRQHDDFILSVMEKCNGSRPTWCCSGSQVPKAEIVYLCQVLPILSIVLASIHNLTNQQGDQQLWVALLSSCMGYLKNNPLIKSWISELNLWKIITTWRI